MDDTSVSIDSAALDVPDCVYCCDTGILVRQGREHVCPFCDENARREIVEQRMLRGTGALRSREVVSPLRAPPMPGAPGAPGASRMPGPFPSNGNGRSRLLAGMVRVGDSVEFVRHFSVDLNGSEVKVTRGGKQIRGMWRMMLDCELHARRLGPSPYVVTDVEEIETDADGANVVMVTVQSSSGRSVTLPARLFSACGTTAADAADAADAVDAADVAEVSAQRSVRTLVPRPVSAVASRARPSRRDPLVEAEIHALARSILAKLDLADLKDAERYGKLPPFILPPMSEPEKLTWALGVLLKSGKP